MNVCCIIQARMNSTRLPGKIMLPLPMEAGKPVLEHVISRVKESKRITNIVVATTINAEDDSVVDIAEKVNTEVYRGSEKNVLERFYFAVKEEQPDYIVRITSDCPCIDPNILDELIEFHLVNGYDYSSNAINRTFPHGLDAEIFSYEMLKTAFVNAKATFELEHVTPYFYLTNAANYKVGSFENEIDYSNVRITLDTNEDYLLLAAVFDYFKEKKSFLFSDIIALFNKKPWLYKVNENVEQKQIFNTVKEEIEFAIKYLEKQDLFHAAKLLEDLKCLKY